MEQFANATDALVRMVEVFSFSDKRKLSEFERQLVIMGASAFITMDSKLIEQFNESEQYILATEKVVDDITKYMTEGPGWETHKFYCEGCAKDEGFHKQYKENS